MTAPKTKKVSVRLRDNRLTQRYRAGIRVTANQVNVDVDKEQLEALNNDPYIVVADPIGATADEETETDTGETGGDDGQEDGNETPDEGDTSEGDGDEETETDGEEEPTQTPEEYKKSLLRNNLDALRKIADEKGVTFKEDDTKAQLADAILAADAK